MKPPSGGPTTGPTSPGIDTQAIASMSSRFGTERSSASRATGIIMAPPAPCTTRPSTSQPSVGAKAQPMEASVNRPTARRKMLRVP